MGIAPSSPIRLKYRSSLRSTWDHARSCELMRDHASSGPAAASSAAAKRGGGRRRDGGATATLHTLHAPAPKDAEALGASRRGAVADGGPRRGRLAAFLFHGRGGAGLSRSACPRAAAPSSPIAFELRRGDTRLVSTGAAARERRAGPRVPGGAPEREQRQRSVGLERLCYRLAPHIRDLVVVLRCEQPGAAQAASRARTRVYGGCAAAAPRRRRLSLFLRPSARAMASSSPIFVWCRSSISRSVWLCSASPSHTYAAGGGRAWLMARRAQGVAAPARTKAP